MNATTQETNNLMPVSQIGNAKLETLEKETGGFKTWIRTNRDGSEFLVNGEPIGSKEIIGVVVDFAPCWVRWPKNATKPEKLFQEATPEGDDWKRRCELEMLTKQYGIVVMDLPSSGFWNFGKFTRDLRVFGKSLSEVFTKAVIGQGKSKKFGVFNTIRFEIAGAFNGGDQKNALAALPLAEESVNEEPAEDAPPAEVDSDFLPYQR